MDAEKKDPSSYEEGKNDSMPQKDDKFRLVSCSNGGIHCKDSILPEINRLYREADIFRVSKEYQKSINALQQAYDKTLELWESSCIVCVTFLQESIAETMVDLQNEVQDMSRGLFATKRYNYVHMKLGQVLKKLNLFYTNNSFSFSSGKDSD